MYDVSRGGEGERIVTKSGAAGGHVKAVALLSAELVRVTTLENDGCNIAAAQVIVSDHSSSRSPSD